MASNGLVANPTKTTFMILNNNRKKDDIPIEINIGQATVLQETSAKLLGVKFQDTQHWNEQVNDKGGVISRSYTEKHARSLLQCSLSSINKQIQYILLNKS